MDRVKKGINLNTVLIILLGLCGWLLADSYRGIRDDIKDIKVSMMPRSEIQLQLEFIKKDIEDVKLRIAVVEKEERRAKP